MTCVTTMAFFLRRRDSKEHIGETSFHVIKIRVRKNVGDAAGRREETACEDLNTRESADETTQFILQI